MNKNQKDVFIKNWFFIVCIFYYSHVYAGLKYGFHTTPFSDAGTRCYLETPNGEIIGTVDKDFVDPKKCFEMLGKTPKYSFQAIPFSGAGTRCYVETPEGRIIGRADKDFVGPEKCSLHINNGTRNNPKPSLIKPPHSVIIINPNIQK